MFSSRMRHARLPRIVAHESRLLLRDRIVVAALAGIALLLSAAIFVDAGVAARQRDRVRQSSAAREAEAARLVAAADSYAASTVPWSVALPPANAPRLATGLSDVTPATADVFAWVTPDAWMARSEPGNPARLRIGAFDAAFVLGILLPLVVIAISHDMLAAERDGGTLSLLGVTGTALSTVLAGKIIARAGLLLVPLACGLATTFVVADQVDRAWLSRLALATAAIAAYTLLWVIAAAAVNVWMGSGSGHAVALIAVWLAWAVAVPAGLQTIVQTLWPAPDRASLIIAARDADPEVARDGRRTLDQFYGDHPELAPSMSITARQDNRRQLYLVFLANQRAVDALASDFDARVRQRRAVVQRWSWLAPPVVLQDLLSSLSGTDLKRHAAYQRQVSALVADYRQYFAPLIVQWQPWTPALAARIPQWRFIEPDTASLAEVWPNWMALLGWTVAVGSAVVAGHWRPID